MRQVYPKIAASDAMNYAETDLGPDANQHPTYSTTSGQAVSGCNHCHNVHDANEATPPAYLLYADNTDSAYCTSCHSAAGAPSVTGGGGATHFTGVPTVAIDNSGFIPYLPFADDLDEDGTVGQDWSTATANSMICETCHSVHRNGQIGYALRQTNYANSTLCTTCHNN